MTDKNNNLETSEKAVLSDPLFSVFRRQLANARTVVAQLKRGEWEFRYNPFTRHCCTAHRGKLELWVGNGAFFCDIRNKNAFGLILRHWVWWAAARKGRKLEDRKNWRAEVPDLSSLNVKVHTPLPARASSETEVKP